MWYRTHGPPRRSDIESADETHIKLISSSVRIAIEASKELEERHGDFKSAGLKTGAERLSNKLKRHAECWAFQQEEPYEWGDKSLIATMRRAGLRE